MTNAIALRKTDVIGYTDDGSEWIETYPTELAAYEAYGLYMAELAEGELI